MSEQPENSLISEHWNIAVAAPLAGMLTYKVPAHLLGQLARGQLVNLPLGKRKARGVLIEHTETIPQVKIKEIDTVEVNYPPLPAHFLKWLEWISDYYMYPIGEVMSLAFPPLEKAKNKNSTRKKSAIPELQFKAPPALTGEQKKVYEEICQSSSFSTHLLFGVTGSGKTEVYMRLLEKVLSEGKRGLVLVPEISLTPQLIHRFVSRFGNKVALLHSQLTDRERTNQWWDIVENRKDILIGARSALFCPIENLGLLIIDEEHEPSYKQDEKLKYHGRDCAIMLAKNSNCPIILGSATPSLETWKNCLDGKYQLHQMKSRVEGRSLPDVNIIDLRDELETRKNQSLPVWLSEQLYGALAENHKQGRQSALFLNRRGVAPIVLCHQCGFTYECPNCDINLTLHGHSHLVCHYCDYHETMKDHCPDCKEGEISPIGLGTELLEKEMQRLFPTARLARADRDEIANRLDLEELIEKMESNKIDILIGTQMIAKGLDFPNLTLVGIIMADIGFNVPDFRSSERSFQLLTQVSGRSGRHIKAGETPGQVIIQTFNPDHPSLVHAKNSQFSAFAEAELQNRSALNYPPFGKLISLRLAGVDQRQVQQTANITAKRARYLMNSSAHYQKIEVLGPAIAPLAKVRGKFRFHLLLKGPEARILNNFCRQLIGNEEWVPTSVKLSADVDPLNLL